MTKTGLIFLLLLSTAALADPAETALRPLDMPPVLIPERDEAVMSLLPKGTINAGTINRESSAALMAAIREEMGERYDEDAAIDEDRIAALISGDYLEEASPRLTGPVNFLNSPFEPAPADAPGAAADVPPGGPVSFGDLAISPEGLRALAGMTPDQIKAVAAMAELSRNPNAEVGALLASARTEAAAPAVMTVGNGETLGLVNWYAALDTAGQVYIANDTLAGSEITVSEGLVVGQFGPVTGIAVDGEQVEVRFASGDVIRSRAEPALELGPAIPALGAIGEDTASDGADPAGLTAEPLLIGEEEILISEGAPRQAETARPRPRPQGLAAAGEAAVARHAGAGIVDDTDGGAGVPDKG